MVDRARAPLRIGAHVGAVGSAGMIAQQVAGKATRDALYLSIFDVRTLPAMMAVSAVLSLIVVVWLSRMMLRHSPARVVPIAFAVSGAAFFGEWLLSFFAPGATAIVLYVHTALFGAVIISSFWSLINETFPPHTGRSAVSWITGGGTVGGVLAGLVTWRASAMVALPTMLLLLAAVNLVSLWAVFWLGRTPSAGSGEAPEARAFAPLRVLRDAPYLRNLALVVALAAVTSGLLDYLFSAAAAHRYSEGPDLLAFFALFWLGVGVLSFACQVLLGSYALERLGLAVTVGLLPGVVLIGGAAALALPGLPSIAVLRGGEAALSNSLFRAAYELFYTPLSREAKRSTKTLIDVGFDRLGTVAASAIALVALYFAPAGRAELAILVVAILCATVGLSRSRALHRGYVAVLQESLKKADQKLEPAPEAPALQPQEKIAIRDEVVEQLDALRTEDPAAFATDVGEMHADSVPPPIGGPPTAEEAPAAIVQAVRDLTSGSPARIRSVLAADAPLAAPLVALTVLLLADKDVHVDAIRALRRAAPRATGQLVDALCDPSLSFDIRRRIPLVLSECRTQCAADGLLRGLDDERFEVRYACGRALLKITPDPAIVITRDSVIAAVHREVERAKATWESQALDDDDDSDSTSLFDRLVRDRIDRSMEHVFNVLALHLDAASLRTAFQALHSEDARLRGTALEYLEAVLPEEVHDRVWPFLGAERPMRTARPASEILADIAQSRPA